jgi:bisphosphoglycerate-dependent phosphoglycerate mutase
MSIESLTTEEVLSLEVPTGVPIIYNYEAGEWSKLE